MPETSRILGAMKLSGKTSSGWSVGVLHAITSREEAQIAAPDELVTAQAPYYIHTIECFGPER